MARPRTFDEAEVLERAVALFREKGFEGARMPELTAHLGICRQSLYNAFGDKRGLYLAALERWGAREVDAKVELLEAEGSPLENVRTVVRGWAATATQCPSDGCLTVNAIIQTGDDEEARVIVERQVERLEFAFRGALAAAVRSGELKKSASPAKLARSLITTCYGIGVLSRLPSSAGRIGDAVAEALERLENKATVKE